ncbi:VOC family protein [Pseudaminobacter arsenicus]|uniref:VOC family protein n=2 Tax=Borborobacter arsenicus TaxID=1851146 RepID=A0A432VCI8_9HYPH|nr:VOC family protein [Pseudaminobacter arsenicus]RUM99882.1 VOC family protein [Pseudaminobacter arsenicus]
MPRSLDHLVLPTASLHTARDRLMQLGFTVAPAGRHPFGTENTCVYFADGTFIEPLATGDETQARLAADEGNVFVARDRQFRARNGDEGFSALVLATGDADGDHAGFVRAGISAGKRLDFSRPFTDASGNTDMASFRLAFAAGKNAPDSFFFTCQRVNAPKVGRSALQAHENGVRRIAGVIAVSEEPQASGEFLSAVAGTQTPVASGGQIELQLANATVQCVTPATFEQISGQAAPQSTGLRLAAIIFGVQALAAIETVLRNNAVGHERIGRRVIVPAVAGQGTVFIFEEIA